MLRSALRAHLEARTVSMQFFASYRLEGEVGSLPLV
jgi:hypothetical protein